MRDLVGSLRSSLHARDLEFDALRKDRDSAVANLERTLAELENRQQYIRALMSSTSWRITAPIRRVRQFAFYVRRGLWAWATFRPGSRPHRMARKFGLAGVLSKTSRKSSGPAEFWFDLAQQQRARKPSIYLFVDHTVDCRVNTGIQRTVRGLASGLIRSGQPVRLVKWDPTLKACVLITRAERAHFARWNGPKIDKQDRNLYRSRSAVAQHPQPSDWLIVPEATCITNQASPVTLDLVRWAREYRAKVGFLFYDAIPLRRPELSSAAPAQKQYMRALRHVDAVWAISSWSAADLTAFLSSEGVDLPPIYTVSLPGEFDTPRAVTSSQAEQLILSVGTIEPRKNQISLVRAFQKYRAKNPGCAWQLVLVGNLHPMVASDIDAATKADPAIRYVGHISDEELAVLFERCAFTVFPSIEEGFGLPIVESLWHGKPCLCANFGSMVEVARGGGCLTCDTRDENALAETLTSLIDDVNLRAELATQARNRDLSCWSDYAGQIVRSAWPIGQIYFLAEATAAWERNTGIQRTVRQLARALLDLGFDVIPVKVTSGGTLEPMGSDDLHRLALFNGPRPGLWRGWLPPEKADDNSWFVMPELPLHLAQQNHSSLIANLRKLNIRSAAIFYDTIPWKMTQLYPEQYRQAHRRYMAVLADYDLVAAISNFSCNDLAAFLKQTLARSAGNVNAIVLPGEFSESPRESRPHVPSTKGPIRILSVGTIEPRKNHETLLCAFVKAAEGCSRSLLLTLVGSDVSIEPSLSKRIGDFADRHNSITWERDADDVRMRELYEAADFTVFASVEEGFGLPILESLWHGRPVICAEFGAMREVAEGGGCVTVDVRDVDLLAEAIRTLAENPSRIAALSQEAVARYFRTWNDYAGELAAQLSPAILPLAVPPSDLGRRSIELDTADVIRQRREASASTIYVLVESTSAYDRNTGIQRVVRQVARGLMRKGAAVIPVRWDF